ncbi:MAG: ABC transporter permease [Bacteroidetes bacterium]|nr:ABC transporter permease [Bacteroidota bacterium]
MALFSWSASLKALTIALLVYVFVQGLLGPVPDLVVLEETIRNLYFHVPLWFAMILMLLGSLGFSIAYLVSGADRWDERASSLAAVSIIFGVLGFATGMLWGNYTWGSLGAFLFSDPKTLGAMIGLLIYLAYFILRGSVDDPEKAARLSAVYSIFAYSLLIFFIFIFPRMSGVDSLHPGSGGNPGFSAYDLDDRMRAVFYPAVFGYTGLGVWISSLRWRMKAVERSLQERDEDHLDLSFPKA